MSARDEYIEKMKAELDVLNVKMTAIEEGAVSATGQAKAKFHEELQKLKSQSAQARTKLEALRDESVQNWEVMIGEMEKVRDALVHSVNYFRSQLR